MRAGVLQIGERESVCESRSTADRRERVCVRGGVLSVDRRVSERECEQECSV